MAADMWKRFMHAIDDGINNDEQDKVAKGNDSEKDDKKFKPRDYRMDLPKIAVVDAVKIFNDPKFLYSYLASEERSFLTGQNFQLQYMRQEPKLFWEAERLHEIGEYVLMFPNPDFDVEDDADLDMNERVEERDKRRSVLNNGISYSDAEVYFDKVFWNNYQFPYKKQFMDSLKSMFTETFLNLNEYKKLTPKELERFKKEQEELWKQQDEDIKKAEKAEEAEVALEALRVEEERIKMENEKNLKIEHDNEVASKIVGSKFMEVAHKINIKDQNEKKESEKITANIKKVTSNENGVLSKGLEKSPTSKGGGFKKAQALMKNAVSSAKTAGGLKKATTPLAKGSTVKKDENAPKINEEDAANPELEQQILLDRQIWLGGSYMAPSKVGKDSSIGTREEVLDYGGNTKHYWTRVGDGMTKDFLTLFRKVTCAVLANQGLLLREIFVKKGRQIAVIITCPEINLMKIAAQMGMSKVVEFGVADLMSLEPIDDRNRPLRVNGYLYSDRLWKTAYIDSRSGSDSDKVPSDQYIINLRQRIVSLLENDCNFKHIVRTCGGTWLEDVDAVPEEIYSHSQLSIEAWQEYEKYLEEVAVRYYELSLLVEKTRYLIEAYYGNQKLSNHPMISRMKLEKAELIKFKNKEMTRAMKEAIEPGKDKKRKYLVCIWDKLNRKPIEYAFPYERANSHTRPRNRQFFEYLWQDYFVNYEMKPGEEPITVESPAGKIYDQRTSGRIKPDDAVQKAVFEENKLMNTEDGGPDKANKEQEKSKSDEKAVKEDEVRIKPTDYFHYHKFNKLERLKIVSYMVNLCVTLD